MFFFFAGVICGIVLAQEVPTIPKLRPYFYSFWNKLKDTSNPTNEGSSDSGSDNGSDNGSGDSSSKND